MNIVFEQRRCLTYLILSVSLLWLGSNVTRCIGQEAATGRFPESALDGHVDQASVLAGEWTIPQLQEAGRRLFAAKFTLADGVGRPGSTGKAIPKSRHSSGQLFVRSSGPDANSCAGCHNEPFVGGAGEFVANVFVGLGDQARLNLSLAPALSAERGTPDIFGAGLVELLAREITADLHAQRDQALADARERNVPITICLSSKSIDFGELTVLPDATVQSDKLLGIDADLVIKPFNQKGTVASLREFTINALNLHHGMQADERYGESQTGNDDFDADGVRHEITAGDVTALTLYQALLGMPGVCLPADDGAQKMVVEGERLFGEIGCAKCHIPALPLDSAVFCEPSRYNVFGTASFAETGAIVEVDLLEAMHAPRPTRDESGKIMVSVFTDFKRHQIADDERPHWNNETFSQRNTLSHQFLTKRLWATGNTAPYGHRGDITTIREAILHHGGEANQSRQQFENLDANQQSCVVEFLKSLQVLPEGSALRIVEKKPDPLPYEAKDRIRHESANAP